MILSEIVEIGKYVISALGGGAVALALFIKFGANKIADLILAKYQNKLDEDLETHKAKVDVKNHVTQFRFDKEFEILHKLVMGYYDFTYLTWEIYMALDIENEEDFNSKYIAFQSTCDEYIKFFYRNSVVISKDIADAFEVGIKHLNDFRWISRHCRDEYIKYYSLGKTDTDGFQTHVVSNYEKLKLIHDKLNAGDEYGIKKMIDVVRNYLDSLEIV